MLGKIKEILSGEAFEPLPEDGMKPLKERFSGKSLLGVIVGLTRVHSALLEFSGSGDLTISNVAAFEGGTADLEKKAFESIKAKHPTIRCMAMALSGGFRAEKVDTAYRKNDLAERIIDQPEAVIGKAAGPGEVYASVASPEAETSVIFSYQARAFEQREVVAKDTGFRLCRLTDCAQAILTWVVEEKWDQLVRADPAVLMIVDFNSIVLVEVQKRAFRRVFFRANARVENPGAVVGEMIAQAFPTKLPETIALVDGPGCGVFEVLAERFPAVKLLPLMSAKLSDISFRALARD